ncbi:hypothetical protein [Hydrogenophaga palleronii]|uniref:hypothetical protein n=1 Tax=Hydrogenophaga palleronii TaxID=65655 RepID=UPI0008271A40|nr:hypothetical protein [Hydrogenophaga palleronii]
MFSIARLFNESLGHIHGQHHRADAEDLAAIRCQMEFCIVDCTHPAARRLRRQILRTGTPQELWLLRNDAYQLISQQFDQATAARRINELRPSFKSFINPRLLVRIR